MRSLIYGVGTNDADYPVYWKESGKTVRCPFYIKWQDMIRRCHDKKFQEKWYTYKDCTVSDEWLSFSAFKNWMYQQDWEGNHLDKDILKRGNKHYSAEYCAFVDSRTNHLFLDNPRKRGKYPIGVTKNWNRYSALCNDGRKQNRIGTYDTPEEAHQAWRIEKARVICLVAKDQADLRVRKALEDRAVELRKPYPAQA